MLKELFKPCLRSTVGVVFEENLKSPSSTKGDMVGTWSNFELAEVITSRAQRIKKNGKEDNVAHASKI